MNASDLRPRGTLMIQGTTSDAGKSTLVAADFDDAVAGAWVQAGSFGIENDLAHVGKTEETGKGGRWAVRRP